MASLVDIARAMDKEKASQDRKPPVEGEAPPKPSKPGLSLVDIAKEQQQAPSAKPLTLVDVARKTEAGATDVSSATAAVSLQNLANEINQEERARIDTAITNVATDVKREKAQERATVLKTAAADVRREEEQTREASRPPPKQPLRDAPTAARRPAEPSPPRVADKSEHDDDGYSSFEDDDVASKKKEEKTPKKTTNGRAKQQRSVDSNDNQSENGSDTGDGPEKTTPSEAPLAKEFLRAIYRGDARRVQDMMRDSDASMDATTADQHGWSALHWAASQSQSEILSILLETTTPRVNAVEHVNGWTALHLAVLRDASACAKQLLRAGARGTIQDYYGDTAYDLLRAVKGKKKERWLQLLDAYRHT